MWPFKKRKKAPLGEVTRKDERARTLSPAPGFARDRGDFGWHEPVNILNPISPMHQALFDSSPYSAGCSYDSSSSSSDSSSGSSSSDSSSSSGGSCD